MLTLITSFTPIYISDNNHNDKWCKKKLLNNIWLLENITMLTQCWPKLHLLPLFTSLIIIIMINDVKKKLLTRIWLLENIKMLPNVDPNYIDFCYTFLYFVRYFVLKKYIFCYTFLKSIFCYTFLYFVIKSINIYILMSLI